MKPKAGLMARPGPPPQDAFPANLFNRASEPHFCESAVLIELAETIQIATQPLGGVDIFRPQARKARSRRNPPHLVLELFLRKRLIPFERDARDAYSGAVINREYGSLGRRRDLLQLQIHTRPGMA